jgi:hypothetical protein
MDPKENPTEAGSFLSRKIVFYPYLPGILAIADNDGAT